MRMSARRILATSTLAALTASALTLPAAATGDAQPRIIDGELATVNPGAVSLSHRAGVHNCSVSLIAPRWILTARHCADDNPKPEVRLGATKRAEGELMVAEQPLPHPRKNPNRISHRIQ